MTKQIRPTQQKGPTPRKKTGCGYLYLTDCINEEYPEFFLRLGKTGGCAAAFLQAIAKLGSLGLRRRLTREDIIRMLSEIKCPLPTWNGSIQVLSCPDAIAKMLDENI